MICHLHTCLYQLVRHKLVGFSPEGDTLMIDCQGKLYYKR